MPLPGAISNKDQQRRFAPRNFQVRQHASPAPITMKTASQRRNSPLATRYFHISQATCLTGTNNDENSQSASQHYLCTLTEQE
jgi:hypothetical protein